MDLLVIMVNNMVYGMTGGQVSPTTPLNKVTITTPRGNIDAPLDTCKIVSDAGANYVARWSVGHYLQLKNSFKEAMNKKGFRFIEVVSQCTARVSTREGLSAAEHMKLFLKNSVPINRISDPNLASLEGKLVVGKYIDRDLPGYIDRLGWSR